MWVTANLKKLRWVTAILAVSNIIVIILGVILALFVYPNCERADAYPFAVIFLVSCVRIAVMIRTGIAQRATAMAVLSSPAEGPTDDALIRRLDSNATKWQHNLLVVFMIMVCCVALVPCCTGSDVLRWRSFYTTEDNAWKAHYREVFDHSIREALCCLGRVKYLTVLEEDEVYSVAQLLGDLVTYRASGTGHLEILAVQNRVLFYAMHLRLDAGLVGKGLALLQRHSQSPKPCDENVEAPEERMHEALVFHPFAEAAYTGLLLDFGRNPVFFPCAWLYRQGILTPWTRKRRPVLEGDNWWRGHAAAFLKYLNLSPETLRKGRVNQADECVDPQTKSQEQEKQYLALEDELYLDAEENAKEKRINSVLRETVNEILKFVRGMYI
ncbi:hypothetical protein RJ640_027171 [Escallonia rubra]|uniref:DUF7358 domain-containing protein n=1 Tax=Escallonia rubra TaxID=112253 RepID=A0AA88UN34_9ASTE|nr:hypothetical protein RJ640_027171 [Escallonia rubra]